MSIGINCYNFCRTFHGASFKKNSRLHHSLKLKNRPNKKTKNRKIEKIVHDSVDTGSRL